MKVIRDTRSNKYCGPAAMSLITGRHVDECVAIIKQHRHKQTALRGVSVGNLQRALNSCGFQCEPLRPSKFQPTLAAAIRDLQGRPADTPYLINVTNHYIVLKGRKIYDNFHPEGIFLRLYPHRRVRVKRMWEITGENNAPVR